jgi:hypothetical protein
MDNARLPLPRDPLTFQEFVAKSHSECAGQVIAPLSPIQTTPSQCPPRVPQSIHIDLPRSQKLSAGAGDLVVQVAPGNY